MNPDSSSDSRLGQIAWLKIALCVACVASAGALLCKAYGVLQMRTAFLAFGVPGGIVLLYYGWGPGRTQRPEIRNALRVGCFGGLIGTAAYDLARLPFHLAGLRVYDPIYVYGIWLADATASSAYTDALGWSYHASNGIAFGIMYALFFRGRAILWAILWGLALETIAICAPTGAIFGISGNPIVIFIAYLGHVAYGLPLGYLVKEWPDALRWLGRIPRLLRSGSIAILTFLLFPAFLWPSVFPARAIGGAELQIDGDRLKPRFVRIHTRETPVKIFNAAAEPREVVVKQLGIRLTVPPGAHQPVYFPCTGIYQLYLETQNRTRSSLAIVEPVENR